MKFIEVLKSKIHRAHVTEADLHYVGSVTIDEDLMEAAGMIENEKVHVLNISNGERFITYVITGKRGSGIIGINGAAAHKAGVGDMVIILSFISMEIEEAGNYKPVVVFPDSNNKLN